MFPSFRFSPHFAYRLANADADNVSAFKGQATMLFIAHMLPKALLVDEVVRFGGPESVNQGSGSGAGQATGPRKDGKGLDGA